MTDSDRPRIMSNPCADFNTQNHHKFPKNTTVGKE